MMIHLSLNDSGYTKKEYIESVIETCKQLFNEALGQNLFGENNVKVAFCDLENKADVYEEFCGQFFPLYLGEGYSRTEPFTAQAFANENRGICGILVCLDADHNSSEWYQIILHELSHIFCIMHEIGGENFTAKYLESNMGNNSKYWHISMGYAVWREFIADYISFRINPLMRPLALSKLKEIVRELDERVNISDSNRAENTAQLLQYIFLNPKIRTAESADSIVRILEKNRVFTTKARCEDYRGMIDLIFEQVKREPCWEIAPEFIEELGGAYSLLLCVLELQKHKS